MNTEKFGKLRPIDDSELLTMLSWRNQENVRKNMYNTHIISEEEHLSWYEKSVRNNPSVQYFMYENAQQKAMGVFAFTEIDQQKHHSFFGIYTAPNAPKGTGSCMMFLALEYAFNVLKFHKLNCEVLAHNQIAQNFYHKFGFQQEGFFREHHLHEGQFCGVYRLAILEKEWQTQRPILFSKLSNRFQAA